MADTLLDPVAPGAGQLAAARARLGALEARLQAIEPRPLKVVPPAGVLAPPNAWAQNVTSGTFTAIWRASMPVLSHPACMVRGAVVLPVGTTGEMQAVLTAPSGTATSTVRPLASGYADTDALGWQHGLALWDAGDCTLELQVRRSGGAGNITVFFFTMALIDPRGCTAGGGTWYPGGWMPGW